MELMVSTQDPDPEGKEKSPYSRPQHQKPGVEWGGNRPNPEEKKREGARRGASVSKGTTETRTTKQKKKDQKRGRARQLGKLESYPKWDRQSRREGKESRQKHENSAMPSNGTLCKEKNRSENPKTPGARLSWILIAKKKRYSGTREKGGHFVGDRRNYPSKNVNGNDKRQYEKREKPARQTRGLQESNFRGA